MASDNHKPDRYPSETIDIDVPPYLDDCSKEWVVGHTLNKHTGEVVARTYSATEPKGRSGISAVRFLKPTRLFDIAKLEKYKLSGRSLSLLLGIKAYSDMGACNNLIKIGREMGLSKQNTYRAAKNLKDAGLISTQSMGDGRKLSITCHWETTAVKRKVG
jgi:hypothetical protein